MTDVKPGQVWADQDPRSAGRTLRVDRIEGTKAVCTVLTNIGNTQWRIEHGNRAARDMRGKTTRIALARFKPASNGYRLVGG
jgi:hypothetical protein